MTDLRQAREHDRRELDAPHGDVADLVAVSEVTSSTGALLMFEVLEHVEDDVGLLQEIHDLLGPGGAILLSVPAHQARFSRVDDMAGHFRRYEKDELASRLRDAGFEPEVFWCYGYPLANLLMRVRRMITPDHDSV